MAILNRREVLRNLLAGLVQASGAAVVVLASASARAGVPAGNGDETPLPEQDPNQQQLDLEQRIEKVAANLSEEAPIHNGDEDSWINGGFRNSAFANGGFANGGFRNSAFANGGGGGGAFRNTAVGGGGIGGGAFRNTAVGGGGIGGGAFRNSSAFRNR